MKERVTVFTTKRLAVRRYILKDAEPLYEQAKELDADFWSGDRFESLEDAKKRLDLVVANYQILHYPIRYAVVLKEGNRLIGSLAYKRMPDYNIREVIILASDVRRKGLGTELAAAAAEYAKKNLGLESIYAVMPFDLAEGRGTAEKAGFTLISEGDEPWYMAEKPVCRYKM